MTTLTLDHMSRDERSLLLYFETCAVDLCGRVDSRRMNSDDFEIAQRWSETGFCKFGRIVVKDHNGQGQHWIELSDEAWTLAHQERLARFKRNPRRYTRTSEKLEQSA